MRGLHLRKLLLEINVELCYFKVKLMLFLIYVCIPPLFLIYSRTNDIPFHINTCTLDSLKTRQSSDKQVVFI